MARKKLKVIIVMPAYNAARTLEKTFKDIPKGLADEIILVDDNSQDNTVSIAKKLGISVIQHKKNIGYGGNQKTCYKQALAKGADIVIMLHPDYQYDAKLLDRLIQPIIDGDYDMMFGSRIRTRQEALKGGMPKIKYILNRFITPIENTILGVNFSEHLSGLRAYHKNVLNKVPFKLFSNDFVFDQQLMASAISFGFRISEMPIPVRYFSESSSIRYLKGIRFLVSTMYLMFQFLIRQTGLTNFKIFKQNQNNQKKIQFILTVVLIFMVTFLAYGQTLGMYFFQDDSALIFKLQNIDVGAGSFGTGVFGRDGLYKYLVTPFVPLYPIFGLNPFGYFLGGVILYFLSAISVYFLGMSITKNKKIALFGSLIFSSGYIGSDTMWRIINSYQTSITIILICATTVLYKRFTENRSLGRYLLAVILFILTVEIGFIRGHGVVFIIAALEVVYSFDRYTLLRLVPFVGIYYRYYILGNTSTSHIGDYVSLLRSNQIFSVLSIPVESLKNSIIPDLIKINSWIVLAIVVLIGVFKKNKHVFFLLAFVVANYITYIIHYPDQSLASTHRYLTPAFAGSAILISLILYELLERKGLYIKACVVLILCFLILVNVIEYKIVTTKSMPTRKFYQRLREEIPKLNKGSVLYFDVRNDGLSQIEFGNSFGVGSMPETTAIAIYYGLDRYDIEMTQSFQELVSDIAQKKLNKNDVYTFFYSSLNGLINTTERTRSELFSKTNSSEINNLQELNFHRISPVEVSFIPQISFEDVESKNQDSLNLIHYLNYLDSRKEYYKTASATSSSEWKYQEREYMIDNDPTTTWRGHRMYWHYEKNEDLTIDLGWEREVSTVRLFNATVKNSPLKYSLSCFKDKWKLIGNYEHLIKNDFEISTIKFSPQTCSKISVRISATSDGDSPQIADIEVVSSEYEDIDYDLFSKFLEQPFVHSPSDTKQVLAEYIIKSGWSTNVCVTLNNSDLREGYCSKVFISSKGDSSSFIIPPGGTVIRSIRIDPPKGLKITLINPTIKKLSIDELVDKGYLHEYAKN